MKKLILTGVAAIVAILLVTLGPALLDMVRLQSYIDSWSASARSDGGAWPRLPDVCAGCHGVKGNSQNQGYPSLAGQPAAYISAQLGNFAQGRRANPNMAPLAMTMSEAQVKALAEYFAKQQAVANPDFEADTALQEKGRQLVSARGCTGCHGEHLMGRERFPRLAGQGHDYLLEQLDAFATGTRTESTGMMQRLASGASTDERKAMAAYLATLKPEQTGRNSAEN